MSKYQIETVIPVPKFGVRMVLVLFGGFFLHLALGTYFTIGNLMPYIISYIRNRTDDTSIRNVDGLWVTSVGGVGASVGMTLGGIIDRRYGPRLATFIGCFIFCASTALSGLTIKKSFFWFATTFGFTISFGTSGAYGPPIQTAIKWLPKRPSLAAGIIVSGFGGGALIFNQVITAYINPDNIAPDLITDEGGRYFTDPDLLDRVPTCFFILGITYFVMQMIGIACITLPPSIGTSVDIEIPGLEPKEDKQMKVGVVNSAFSGNGQITSLNAHGKHIDTGVNADIVKETTFSDNVSSGHTKDDNNVNDADTYTANNGISKSDADDLSITEAIKLAFRTRSFYIVWITVLCIDGGMQFFIGLYKAYGQTFIVDDHFLALIGSLSSIFNCVGRPFWGLVMDKFGFKVAIRCISFGFVVLCSTVIFTEQLIREAYLVWICAIFFFFCGIWSVTPSTLAKLFGVKNMAVNYGFVNSALAIAALIGGITGTTLKAYIGWHGMFFMSAGMGAVPFLMSFFFNGVDKDGKPI